MANYDESILRTRLIRPDAPFPFLHQALRIALYDEYAARAFYMRVVEAFGARPPFSRIVEAEARHIAGLSGLCERYGVPRPLDPFLAETAIAPTWRANLERAAAGEFSKIRRYAYLLPWVAQADVQRTFAALQAAARDDHLPAFQQALQQALALEGYHAAQGVPPNQAYVRHGPLTNFIEQGFSFLARQHGAFGIVGSLVSAAHPALLAGMVAGGAAVHLLRSSPDNLESLAEED